MSFAPLNAMYEPFAGIYATKMIPNNQPDIDTRFKRLIEAIKFVYASTFFKNAKNYMQATNHDIKQEKMAVIIQEVVGERFKDKYYPTVSGVARSYNFYPIGKAKPEDGVVNLAFGLGKTIVDGGITWAYSPKYPKVGPPFGSVNNLLKNTQTDFWAVNMGKPPSYHPTKETEFLIQKNIVDAEQDGTLKYVASTIDMHSGRIYIGTGSKGPRILNFAPLLQLNIIPLNDLLKHLLKISEAAVGAPVEIEFAISFNPNFFGFLQVRPMVVSTEKVEIDLDEMKSANVLLASKKVMGNGIIKMIKDIVYVKPEKFDAKYTQKIKAEVASLNIKMVNQNIHYLLIGFGRWGSSDPWLGIPVDWSDVSAAKVIVEATLPKMNIELSQGSHFFHNLTSFNVPYFSVPFTSDSKINWEWLNTQKAVFEGQFVRHLKLNKPLTVKVDGRNSLGVIFKP